MVVGGDASTVESVIRRRIEPAQFEWLSSVVTPGQQLPMLQRAGTHFDPDVVSALEQLHARGELAALTANA